MVWLLSHWRLLRCYLWLRGWAGWQSAGTCTSTKSPSRWTMCRLKNWTSISSNFRLADKELQTRLRQRSGQESNLATNFANILILFSQMYTLVSHLWLLESDGNGKLQLEAAGCDRFSWREEQNSAKRVRAFLLQNLFILLNSKCVCMSIRSLSFS